MITNIINLIVGLILLIYFSNLFVDSAVSIANSFKVPKMVIALTIAAFCTCTPELAISFTSISSGNYDVTIANVVGSSIVNVLLIVGIAGIVNPISIKSMTVRRELPLLFLTTSVFVILFSDGILSRMDSLILILFFVMFCLYLMRLVKNFTKVEEEVPKYGKFKSLFLIVLSLGLIMYGSDMVVDSTTYLAEYFDISTKIITMTVVVIGTSLPELTITVTSALKNEFDMTVGNIIGTNIFNICVVLGLPTLIFGNVYTNSFNFVDLFVVIMAALLFFLLGKSDRKITRREGILMVLIFISYYIYLFVA